MSQLSDDLTLIEREPVLVSGTIGAAVAVAASFGLVLTDQQSAAIVALVLAVLALVRAVLTRRATVPVTRARRAVARATVAPHPASLDVPPVAPRLVLAQAPAEQGDAATIHG